MAETLLSFGVEKLWDLLAREFESFQEFGEKFDELKRVLKLLRAFLEDADAKKHTNKMVKTCLEDIREIVFDAEDIIETFLLKKELGQTSGIRKRMRRLSCIVVDRRNIGSDIGGISTRISNVTRDMQSFGVQQMIVKDGESSNTVQERQREVRKTFPSNSENNLVGLEENVKKLVGYLVEEDNIQVVSITGMGGIGKTTLAREVFNHEMVKNHFDGVAWVCISQDFTRTYVWETILQQLTSKHNEQKESNMTEEMLQNKLYRLLETSNSLIVLDDMWKEEDWDRIKHVFPSKKGWKILVTSRNEDVALHADPSCVTFRTDCLTPEESWTLFQRIASPRENTNELKVDDKMEEMGKQMIKHCGGLPLAIKVLGGLLATQYTLREWERVYENIKSRIVGGTSFNDRNISSVYHVLYLSFEELPIYLKHCFLYLAHFPEDRPIDVEKLSYLWAAEEIPRPRYYDEETVREVGDCYIEELVKRNMVISKRDDITSRFETCQLHDMMREVCLFKSGEENFVHIFDTANAQSSCKSRRMAILDNFPKGKMMNPKLRSILFINRILIAQRVCFTRLQLMRVLDLVGASFRGGKLPSSIGKLIHLRYLNLKWTEVSHLPSSLGNLKLLIYLNLDTFQSSIYVPNVLMGMQELRYLALPFDMHKKTKLELRNLEKLETLKNFSTKNGSIEDLCGMVRLRTLDIKLEDETSIETLSASIGGLRHLEYLTIEDWSDERMNKVGFVMDFIHLKELELHLYMPRLPKEQHFPSHLTKISLRYCCLEEDPMPILEKLFQLKEVRLLYNSFSGRRMVCSGGGFPQLQELFIGGLMEWEEWIVEEGSMPLLHTLQIWDCRKLKELPDGQHCPCQLTTISIIECCFEEDPMPILEKLLQLKDVRLGIEYFSGNRMVCSGGGFPQLHKLEIWRLLELEEWIVEEGSMPLLHTMIITRCEKLKELPDGLRFIYSLKRLEMDKEWKERLSEGGADYYKVQHIPSIEFREDDD